MGFPRILQFAWLALCCPAFAQDPRDIIRKSVSVDNHYSKRAQEYTMVQRTTERVLSSNGSVKSTTTKAKDVFYIHGERYSRLLERDGKPLPPEEEKKEQAKLEKRLAERRNETESQRKTRLAEHEKQRLKEREFLQELADAFDFKLLPDASLEGRPVWVIQATPRPGYKPRLPRADMFAKMRGTMWIDKSDYEWVKMDAETIDTISFGYFIARLAKGTRFTMEQTRLNDEVWLPKRFQVRYDARLALLKHQTGEVEEIMGNFKKFQTDSRIVSITER